MKFGIYSSIADLPRGERLDQRIDEVALMRNAWVAETRAEAEEVYGPEVMTAYKYYCRNGLSEFRSIRSEEGDNSGQPGGGPADNGGPGGMRGGVPALERGRGRGILPAAAASRPFRSPTPREDNRGDTAFRGNSHTGLRLGECPGRARELVNQGYRIEMTRLPVTRHMGESRYPESLADADCSLVRSLDSRFRGKEE